MNTSNKNSSKLFIALWSAQIVVAALLLAGTWLKFQPIAEISKMMPWTGEVPVWAVRLLGVIDLLGALGLILPAWLRIWPALTPVAAWCVVALMISAIVFHLLRDEALSIGINVVTGLLAAFVALGRPALYHGKRCLQQ